MAISAEAPWRNFYLKESWRKMEEQVNNSVTRGQ